MTNESIFEEHKNIVYYCYNKLYKDDFILKSKEDILQEGFFALWRGVVSYDDSLGIKLSTYFFACVQNAMLRWINVNKNFYYNCCSMEDPVVSDDGSVLTIGDTLYEEESIEDISSKINEILQQYKSWLLKTRKNVSEKYLSIRLFRAHMILTQLVTKERVTLQFIEEECDINRTAAHRIFKELRLCLQDNNNNKENIEK